MVGIKENNTIESHRDDSMVGINENNTIESHRDDSMVTSAHLNVQFRNQD
jgi:hypothetical protein